MKQSGYSYFPPIIVSHAPLALEGISAQDLRTPLGTGEAGASEKHSDA